MSIGSIGGGFGNNIISPTQGFFNSDGNLLRFMTSLSEQKKAISNNNQNFNRDLFNNLGQVRETSAQLRSEISGMAGLNQFSSRTGHTPSSSNEDVLTAKVANNAPVSSHTKTDVNVAQLASAQRNEGAALSAAENSFGDSFNLSITDNAGKTTSFSVGLGESNNNRDAIQSMAERINSANTGVRATVVENTENGTVSLQLTGTRTGAEDGRFTVNDSSAANAGNVAAESGNAQFTVNGREFSTQTNDVRLQEGVNATLRQTGSTQITYDRDLSSAVSQVQNFVNTFNNLRDAASDSRALHAQLSGLTSNFNRALGFSGLGTDSEGRLRITDESALRNSISDGSFARNFQGVNTFGNSLSNVTGNAFKTAYDSAIQQNFKDLMETMKSSNSANNWQDYMSATLNSGLLFNMLA